jgi:predicted GIY-YIG superfamily endonuclease
MVDLESVDGYPEKVDFRAEKPAYLYVLRLFDGRYYVGVTKAPKRRVISHVRGPGLGAEWTELYPPVAIESVIGFEDRERARTREDEVTEALARYHGPGRVRGGRWSAPEDRPPGGDSHG